jgi:hypothetical protein
MLKTITQNNPADADAAVRRGAEELSSLLPAQRAGSGIAASITTLYMLDR